MWIDDQLSSLLAEVLVRGWKKRTPHIPDHVVVGKVVRVTDRISPGKLGAVLIPVRSGVEEYYARADGAVAIPAGRMVRVCAVAPPRTVTVEPVERVDLSKPAPQEH